MGEGYYEVQPGGFVKAGAPAGTAMISRDQMLAECRAAKPKTSTKEEFYQAHPSVFVRVGAPAESLSANVDTNMLAVMEFAPKDELLDEIFKDNQGAGGEQFNRVQIFRTKGRWWVYQIKAPQGFSKYWWPYDPRSAGDPDDGPVGTMVRAEIPKGTIVGVGIVGRTTRWYIPSTYGKASFSNRRLPPSWRLEVVPDLPTAADPLPGSV